MHRGKAYGGKVLHNLKDTLKVESTASGAAARQSVVTLYISWLQTLQQQSKGVAEFESLQAVQYLSVQVHPTQLSFAQVCYCVHTFARSKTTHAANAMQVNALQKGFLTLSDALLEELGEPFCVCQFIGLHAASLDFRSCRAESVKQERDSLATSVTEIRHETSRKMADMQQRFDHVYAMMQDCQVCPVLSAESIPMQRQHFDGPFCMNAV